jgi:hypothetical protein
MNLRVRLVPLPSSLILDLAAIAEPLMRTLGVEPSKPPGDLAAVQQLTTGFARVRA